MAKAGRFELNVGEPYPVHCTLTHELWEQPIRFNHKELSDLHYVVTKAMQEARLKLGDDKEEV